MDKERLRGKGPQIIDFRHITSEEENSVKRRIFQNNGEVLILIHPFFREHEESDIITSAKQYSHSTKETDFISCYPGVVFIFEESTKSFLNTKRRITFTPSQAIVLMVPTKAGYPHPIMLDSHSTDEQQWNNILEELTKLSVKKIVLGGRELYFKLDFTMGGCVPIAAGWLKKKFEVKYLPFLCYPDEP